MLGKTISLYRAEVTLNGKTSNIFFEDKESFNDYVEMMCVAHKEDEFEICSHSYYDLQVVGC